MSRKYSEYLGFIFSAYILFFLIRLYEFGMIIRHFGYQPNLCIDEITGYGNDLLLLNGLFLVLFFPYFLLHHKVPRLLRMLLLVVVLVTGLMQFYVVRYFVYQLQPLDVFLYQYSLKEIWYTITTSNVSLWVNLLVGFCLIITGSFLCYFFSRIRYSSRFLWIKVATSILAFLVLLVLPGYELGATNFSSNKSFYFLRKTFSFLNEPGSETINERYLDLFHDANGGGEFVSDEFSLLHEFESKDVIGSFFRKSESRPNIVFLLIEGLNDDFIHSYKGVHLMPFLEKLKEQSLYWERAFTLGERSFAVVPSVLGALPYGEKGFTLQEKYPLHFSLVSVLKANGYYTSFFYGQGSWFHNKDHFFRYNNIDLLFDNSKFSDKYSKIIVGDDNFFWGYSDKDLFCQSLEVLDTLGTKDRLDVYYTGTMHGPFHVSEEARYDSLFRERLSGVENTNDLEFFSHYQKYLRTTIFTDDALVDFLRAYEKRDDYDRTIFIITGDHPMTEVPIANSLKRYHVPIIIYSPMLVQHRHFRGVVSHLDVAETLNAFLSANYGVQVPGLSASLGTKLDTSNNGNMDRDFAFMNTNREIIDYFSDGQFISNGKDFFEVDENLGLHPSTDQSGFNEVQDRLNAFRTVNRYVCSKDKILPRDVYLNFLGYKQLSGSTESGIDFNGEYHDILKTIPVSGDKLFFEVNLTCEDVPDDGLIVYQLTNKKDSMLLWRSIALTEKVNELIPVENINRQDTSYFHAYFWNRSKRPVKCSEIEAALFLDH